MGGTYNSNRKVTAPNVQRRRQVLGCDLIASLPAFDDSGADPLTQVLTGR